MQWSISETVNASVFKPLPLCSAPLSEKLLVGITGALGMKESHFLSKNMCFEEMVWGISEMVTAGAFKPLPLCSVPLKTY